MGTVHVSTGKNRTSLLANPAAITVWATKDHCRNGIRRALADPYGAWMVETDCASMHGPAIWRTCFGPCRW
jgi:hypothetical protein